MPILIQENYYFSFSFILFDCFICSVYIEPTRRMYKGPMHEPREDQIAVLIGRRVRAMRRYRRVKQVEAGAIINVTQSTYSLKEAGEIAYFSAAELALLLAAWNFDARWPFGQIESIEEADLSLRAQQPKDEQLLRTIQYLGSRCIRMPRFAEVVRSMGKLDDRGLEHLQQVLTSFQAGYTARGSENSR
jgi:transcriptional regulator with XRE-family HTH domain